MKVDLEQVEATLLERKVEQVKVAEIIKDLTQAVEEEKEDRKANAVPKAKWEFLVYLNDPEGTIKGDYTAWIVQQKEGQDACLATGKLTEAARAQNEGSKRKKNLIKCFAELFEFLKPKFAKEKGMYVKTKEPVRVFVINGKTM